MCRKVETRSLSLGVLTSCLRRRFFLQFLRRDQSPGFIYVEFKFFILHPIQFDTDSAGATHVGRTVKFFRVSFNQHRLNADGGWNADGDVSIVVVIV